MTNCRLCDRPTFDAAALAGVHPCCARYHTGRSCPACTESDAATERWKRGAPGRAARARQQAALEEAAAS